MYRVRFPGMMTKEEGEAVPRERGPCNRFRRRGTRFRRCDKLGGPEQHDADPSYSEPAGRQGSETWRDSQGNPRTKGYLKRSNN